MLTRANKITALLVTAASLMSVAPAMAATTQKLETKDGTVENAVAYKDGKYVYEGYKSNSDNEGIYYTAGGKDKLLEDVSSANLGESNYTTAYEGKYATALDGNDEYLIDLSSGSVVGDNTAGDKKDTATIKLKSALKKTDRYGNTATINSLAQITSGPKFGDVWYSYTATPTTRQGNSTTTGNLYGYTNQTGTYIDASNLANIYAYSTTKGKVVKIDEFDKTDSSTGLTATITAAPVVLTQDKDYIYAKVEVNITDNNTKSIVTGTKITATATTGTVTHRTYIQKISKSEGDKKDVAYLPKSVDSYEVTTGEFNCSNATDAKTAIGNATSYSVVNGQLLALYNSGSNVKVTSINLKKDKVNYSVAPATSSGSSFGTSDKVDIYLAEKDNSDNVDVSSDGTAYDVDVDGNFWVVSKGKIYKFQNNTMTKVYTCDSSLNSISVYDTSNLITWKKDGNIYTTINSGTAAAATGTTTVVAPVTTVKTGWDKLANGAWNFYDLTGAKVASKWVNAGGVWYYLKADGVMATGWLNDSGTWYYLNSSGAMKTGWLNDNGTWYYLNSNGSMAANTVINGYRLSSSGALA